MPEGGQSEFGNFGGGTLGLLGCLFVPAAIIGLALILSHPLDFFSEVTGTGSTPVAQAPVAHGVPGDPSRPFSGTWEGVVQNSDWHIKMTLVQDEFDVTGTITYSNCSGKLVVSTAATMTSTIVAQKIPSEVGGPYCSDGTKWYLDVVGNSSMVAHASLAGDKNGVFRADLIRDECGSVRSR